MSALFADALIYVLLLVGVVFAILAVLGLLIFPDIKSRMFTGFRAALISCGATILAGITYGLFKVLNGAGDQYGVFVGFAILFLIIIVTLNQLAAREIQKRVPPMKQPIPSGTMTPADPPVTPPDE